MCILSPPLSSPGINTCSRLHIACPGARHTGPDQSAVHLQSRKRNDRCNVDEGATARARGWKHGLMGTLMLGSHRHLCMHEYPTSTPAPPAHATCAVLRPHRSPSSLQRVLCARALVKLTLLIVSRSPPSSYVRGVGACFLLLCVSVVAAAAALRSLPPSSLCRLRHPLALLPLSGLVVCSCSPCRSPHRCGGLPGHVCVYVCVCARDRKSVV